MIFTQFSRRNSPGEISNGLRSATGNLNHLGLSKAPSKSSISYQNKHRDWKLFQSFYYTMLETLSAEAGSKQIKFRITATVGLVGWSEEEVHESVPFANVNEHPMEAV